MRPATGGGATTSTTTNEEWLRWFPNDPPARQGAKLPVRVPGMKVSIAVIAEAKDLPRELSVSEESIALHR